MERYAHTGPSGTLEDGQLLSAHLDGVARSSSAFAGSFGYAQWGYALGVLHDIGKVSPAFQRRLHGSSERVDHASLGAAIAAHRWHSNNDLSIICGRLLSLAIAGHHGGIPNKTSSGERTSLRERLAACSEDAERAGLQYLDDQGFSLPEATELEVLPILRHDRNLPPQMGREQQLRCNCFSMQLLGRMLYSCLVDADYLDTESFTSPDIAELRNRPYDTVSTLTRLLDEYMQGLVAKATPSRINQARASILEDCRKAARWQRGIYTLSVPTGGGKTLSSMMFAMHHAKAHSMHRVVYGIPFTSVADQNAAVFQGVFGRQNVLVHHSNYEYANDERLSLADNELVRQSERLATQRWDAPIVVTTNVQLFESLFSNKPGKCRKLHHLANSVIVLDEAQTLPDSLLKPTLATLEDLVVDFGCTVLLCTATQPALDAYWPFGARPKEIVSCAEQLAETFAHRVTFAPLEVLDMETLASDLAEQDQALCIIGTKPKALSLYRSLVQLGLDEGILDYGDDPSASGFFHLSTNMVPLHRRAVLQEIRERLAEGRRCVVVSTQLVEAGVDVDFPMVYREIAGIDSIMQAAGRCNREGRLVDAEGQLQQGTVHIFQLSEDAGRENASMVSSWLGAMKGIALNLIRQHGGIVHESQVRVFFQQRYQANGDKLDRHRLLENMIEAGRQGCETLEYERYASEYRIIDDDTDNLVIPWGEEGRKLVQRTRELAATGEAGVMALPLQRVSVGVYPRVLRRLFTDGVVEEIGPFHVLAEDSCLSRYSHQTGLLPVGEEDLNCLIS